MVEASDFVTDGVQATAYVASEELAPAKVLRRVIEAWADVYDADPVSIPLPPSVPSDVPGVILISRDGSRRPEIARSRVNLYAVRLPDQPGLEVESTYRDFAGQLAEIFQQDGTQSRRRACVDLRGTRGPEHSSHGYARVETGVSHWCRRRGWADGSS